LLDSCYDRERFPKSIDEAKEWVWVSTKEEEEALEFVLSRFFELIDGEFVQKRIAEEIDKYQERSETNKRIAIERETKRREIRTKRAGHVNEAPPNHKPITNNHNNRGFAPPTITQVNEYIKEKKYSIDGDRFINFYASKGWMVGKNKMKDWKAAVRNWSKSNSGSNGSQDYMRGLR
jgi:uncharacterized protein YdaU (DUF1376 family)